VKRKTKKLKRKQKFLQEEKKDGKRK